MSIDITNQIVDSDFAGIIPHVGKNTQSNFNLSKNRRPNVSPGHWKISIQRWKIQWKCQSFGSIISKIHLLHYFVWQTNIFTFFPISKFFPSDDVTLLPTRFFFQSFQCRHALDGLFLFFFFHADFFLSMMQTQKPNSKNQFTTMWANWE